jgi:hypothetical protein
MGAVTAAYTRRRPEETTLYAVVRDNLATLYGAVADGALPISLPAFVRKEFDGYLACGMLCHGFARLRCDGCEETRVVAFRGFGPSCLDRKNGSWRILLTADPFAGRTWMRLHVVRQRHSRAFRPTPRRGAHHRQKIRCTR